MSGSNRLLLVETDPGFRRLLNRIAEPIADVESAGDFASARTRMLQGAFDLVIANLRLSTHNGLHLVYLLGAASLPTRGVLYGDRTETSLAREAQRVGAFFEVSTRLLFALPAYVRADLPVLDRRDPTLQDRRARYRGGRRGSDVPLAAGVVGA
jgi:DNA-binding NtrC family response regulator